MSFWRVAVALLLVAGYALLSHALMLHAADRPWAVAALLGPLVLAVLGMAIGRRHAPTLMAALAALLGLAWWVRQGGLGDLQRLYLAQHMGIHVALGTLFATSLRGPGPSLIGSLAERVHGVLTPDMAAYTRRVTWLWVGYFFGMAAVSAWVFTRFSWSTWSLLANVATPCCIAAVFMGEYLLRYRLHPEFERAGLVESMLAFSQRGTPRAPVERST